MNVYGYVRVSTDKQQLSINAQGDRIKKYCEFKGMELKKLFVDQDVSGSVLFVDRPAGDKLDKQLKRNDEVVTVCLDRCFRNASDGINTLFQWEDRGVVLNLADTGLIADTTTAAGFLTISMQLVIGQYERMIIGERTSYALKKAQSEGKRMSRHMPYGMMPDESSKRNETGLYEKMVICEKEQEILKMIFARTDEGMNASKITEVLNVCGSRQRNGKSWCRQTIWRFIAKREQYE